jgi:hypothetical protein
VWNDGVAVAGTAVMVAVTNRLVATTTPRFLANRNGFSLLEVCDSINETAVGGRRLCDPQNFHKFFDDRHAFDGNSIARGV